MTDAIIVIIMIKSYALAVIIPLVVLSISALCVKQKKALSLAVVDLVNAIICIKRTVSHLSQKFVYLLTLALTLTPLLTAGCKGQNV